MTSSIKELAKIDVYVLEWTGRGKRIGKELLIDMDETVNSLYRRMYPTTKMYKEYYIYGHSMGTLLRSFNQGNEKSGGPLPTHFIVFGRVGLRLPSDEFGEILKEQVVVLTKFDG